jgi:hypothetical protein
MKENRSTDRHCRPSTFFRLLRLYWNHFKERQSFFLLLVLLLLLLFFFIHPLQLIDAFCFNNGVLVKASTSCFNDLARSIRRFVVTISHWEYTYIHKLVKKYEKNLTIITTPSSFSYKFVSEQTKPILIIFFFIFNYAIKIVHIFGQVSFLSVN